MAEAEEKQAAKPGPQELTLLCRNGLERNGTSKRRRILTGHRYVATSCPDRGYKTRNNHAETTAEENATERRLMVRQENLLPVGLRSNSPRECLRQSNLFPGTRAKRVLGRY